MQTNNKLREALLEVQRCANGALMAISYENVPTQYMWDIIDICKAALAAPVKNCEVGTAEEQLKRFKDFCRMISRDEICDGCPLLPQCPTLEHCTLAWAQMPYEEGGAK